MPQSAQPALRLPKQLPWWAPPAIVAVVCWLAGARQTGPIAAYGTPYRLPFAWHLFEQAFSMAATVAALGAAAALARATVSARYLLDAASRARWPLALAAAIASSSAASPFLPAKLEIPDQLHLPAVAIAWAIAAFLALALCYLWALLIYLRAVALYAPRPWPAAAVCAIALIAADLASRSAMAACIAFLWPLP